MRATRPTRRATVPRKSMRRLAPITKSNTARAHKRKLRPEATRNTARAANTKATRRTLNTTARAHNRSTHRAQILVCLLTVRAIILNPCHKTGKMPIRPRKHPQAHRRKIARNRAHNPRKGTAYNPQPVRKRLPMDSCQVLALAPRKENQV